MQVQQIKINTIQVVARQRTDLGDLDALAESIQRIGLQSPIVVEFIPALDGCLLIAGQRRLEACKLLKWTTISAVLLKDLDANQRAAIELEENIKRKQLAWEEEVSAVRRYHEARCAQQADWTAEQTADSLGLSSSHIGRCLAVARALKEEPTLIAGAEGIKAAYNILNRRTSRIVDDSLSRFIDLEASQPQESQAPGAAAIPGKSYNTTLLVQDFLTWAPSYSAEPFNLIHCDFPYGISLDEQAMQGTRSDFTRYADSPQLYWDLLMALLTNKERLIAPSAHIIFWFSMTYYESTVATFRKAGFVVNPFPLVWVKSDGKGILPDPERGPRRCYETALFVTRGDRKIVRAVSNCLAAPTNKADAKHISEKPRAVVEHFLRMCCDDLSSLLDPTCGSATALCAAESLGAKRILGMDIDPAHIEIAEQGLKAARASQVILGSLEAAAL